MDDDNVLFVRYEDFYKVGVTYRSNSVCNQSIRNVEILVLMTTRSSNRIYIIGWMILWWDKLMFRLSEKFILTIERGHVTSSDATRKTLDDPVLQGSETL